MQLVSKTNILIVGLGLMGGSYAKGFAKAGIQAYAVDLNEDALRFAKENHWIKDGSTDPSLVKDSDLVISCLYPHTFIQWVKDNQKYFRPGTLLSDVTGVKRKVISAINDELRKDCEFIACHPMAGRESRGLAYADESRFENANFIIVPTEKNTKEAVDTAYQMARILKFGRVCELSAEELRGITKIIITACGSAYYAGCSGRYALERLCRVPVQVELASELRYSDPMVDEHTLVLVISQSGETADTIAALKECKARGAKVIGIVNVVGSTIAKLADFTLYTFAGPEIAVATTKGYTTQLTVLYLFALYMAEKLGRIDAESYTALVKELQHLPRKLQQTIDMNWQIPKLASRYASHSLFFIGRNTDYAVALEGALKMKEISYLHAESYAAGELKHGTIALIEENQPVIAVCCNEALLDKTLSNIVEVKARGAKVLALSCKGNKKIVSQADDVIFIPRVETVFSAVLAVVPLQLLAYYAAKEKGCDIDKPKNLAKSVTVE